MSMSWQREVCIEYLDVTGFTWSSSVSAWRQGFATSLFYPYMVFFRILQLVRLLDRGNDELAVEVGMPSPRSGVLASSRGSPGAAAQ